MLYLKQNWYPLHSASFTLVTQFPSLLQKFKYALSFIIFNENSYKNKLLIKWIFAFFKGPNQTKYATYIYINIFFYESQFIRCIVLKKMANNDFFSITTLFFCNDITTLYTITTVILHKLPKNSKLGIILFRKIVYCTESCLLSFGFFIYIQYINTHWSIYKINCWVSYKYQPSRGPGLRSRNKDGMVGPDYSIAVHFWHHKPHFPDQPMRVEFYFRPRDTQFSWFPYRVRTWPSDRKWTQSHQRWETQRGNLCSARTTSHIV